MDKRPDLRHGYFFTLRFFYVIFYLTLLRPTALRLLHVANAHFQRDYNTYLSEAELHGYYAWGRLRSLPVGNTLQCAWTITRDYGWLLKMGQDQACGVDQVGTSCRRALAAQLCFICSTRRWGEIRHLCQLQVFPEAIGIIYSMSHWMSETQWWHCKIFVANTSSTHAQ